MICPECGFRMADTDVECPRCKHFRARGIDPRQGAAQTPPAAPQSQKGAWPPPPQGGNWDAAQAGDLDGRTDAERLLTLARWSLLAGFFCLPVVGYPLAFYYGLQANRKGGRGQGTPYMVAACVLALVSVGFVVAAYVTGLDPFNVFVDSGVK